MPEFEIALHTGMRCSEQYGITWQCVDLENHIVTVPRAKNGELRHVKLNSLALMAMKALHARSIGSGPVFPTQGPRHWFEPAVEFAGLKQFTWHCLRHTFASRLVMAGVDLRTVQELMGHKTIQMTCRYAHLAPEHQAAAVEKLCVPTATLGATEPAKGKNAETITVN